MLPAMDVSAIILGTVIQLDHIFLNFGDSVLVIFILVDCVLELR